MVRSSDLPEPEPGLFVDRQGELATLRAKLAEASTGRPRFVLVEGEKGIGKTALLRRFAADTDGVHLLSASGDESETLLEYGVVEHLCRFANVPLPGELVGITDRSSVLPEPFSVGNGLLELLNTIDQGAPVVLVVDNAHLADASSQLALLFAFRRLLDCRLLAVLAVAEEPGTLRPGLSRLVDSDAGARIRLRGLDAPEIAELGTQLSGQPVPRGVVEGLRDHTGGNPLHVRALIEELNVASLGGSPEAVWPAPRSFSLVVSDRLTSCSPAARRLVAAAAVVGMHCPFAVVRELSGVEQPLQALQEGIDAHLVEYRQREREVSFGHPLVRAAVYHDLGVCERAELHAGAALLVGDEAEALRHRAAAATGEDEALAADLAAFAAREAARGSWASAAAMFVQAASLAPDGPQREPIVLDAVESLLHGGDVLGAHALAGPLETFTDAARSQYLLGQLALLSGRPDEAERLLTAAWERCPENDRVLAVKIAEELAHVTLACLRAEKAITWSERALTAAEETPFAYRPLPYLSLALACMGRVTEAVDAVAALPEPGEASAELESYLLARTFARIYSGAIGEARDDAARLVTTACRSGRLFPHTVGLAMLSLTEYRIGAWDDAITHAELGASLAEDAEFLLSLSSLHAVAAWPLAGRGEWDSAEGHARAAADTANTLFTTAMATMAEAAVAGARGQHQRVIDAVTSLRAMGAAVDEDDLWPWRELYVGALIGMDRLDDAEAELEPFEAVAAARRSPLAMSKASRLRGSLEMARGRNEKAGAALDRALEHSSTVPAPFDRALAQASRGAFLRREGNRCAAVEQLEAAREGFVRLGARPFVESCDRELASCGPLPPGRRPVDPCGFTPKEMSVATLVTQGKTNREVASELAVSVNTVEYHLKKIYAKLGINSRSQLIVRLGVPQEDIDGDPR